MRVNSSDVSYTNPAWNIEYSGIPKYDHVVTQDEVDALNNRPLASSDFTTGSTTISAGETIPFGTDIGYDSTGCDMGYWPPGPACPEGEDRTSSFLLEPSPETVSGGCYAELGKLGTLFNGAAMYGWSDGTSYNSESVWHPTALGFELYDLGICWGHAAGTEYHHHSYSHCAAELLGDDGSAHSPLWGFINDGYPIYGPYDAAGELAVSCWQARDYSSGSITGCGTDNERSCVMNDPYDMNSGTTSASSGPTTTTTTSTQSGNTIDAVSGIYFEDYFFNSTCAAMGQKYLDSFNGHSHGNLGYHYHFTLSQEAMDDDGTALPTFPYIIGPKYYGCRPDASCCTGPSAGACNDPSLTSTTGTSTCGTSLASSTFACTDGLINDDFYNDNTVVDDVAYGDDDDAYSGDDIAYDDDDSGTASVAFVGTTSSGMPLLCAALAAASVVAVGM